MARRSSSRSAPRRAPSPRPQARRAASTAASPRPVPKKPAPPPQKAAPTAPPAPAAPSAAGGFMANVASTGLGVMAGRAMDRAIFGGSASAAPEAEPAAAFDDSHTGGELAAEDLSDSVCQREIMEFRKCMQANGSNVAACQWNIDILAACQRQQEAVGFADAPRL